MKSDGVAKTMRLDLARYREVAAFAQFGSDLDAGTQQQLRRGDRLIELLKQPQHQPLPVEKEIVSIFCGSNGYLDDLELSDIARFELEFLAYMDQNHGDILNETQRRTHRTVEPSGQHFQSIFPTQRSTIG
jgi:F-type H+-transporting ATPase subunit alpha